MNCGRVRARSRRRAFQPNASGSDLWNRKIARGASSGHLIGQFDAHILTCDVVAQETFILTTAVRVREYLQLACYSACHRHVPSGKWSERHKRLIGNWRYVQAGTIGGWNIGLSQRPAVQTEEKTACRDSWKSSCIVKAVDKASNVKTIPWLFVLGVHESGSQSVLLPATAGYLVQYYIENFTWFPSSLYPKNKRKEGSFMRTMSLNSIL